MATTWCFRAFPTTADEAIQPMKRFRALKIAQIICAAYILIVTFTKIGGLRDTETGLIVDQASAERTEKGLILVNGTERAIVGATAMQLACFGVSRASAWIMYPGKCIAIQRLNSPP